MSRAIGALAVGSVGAAFTLSNSLYTGESAGKVHNIFAYIRSLFWIRICDTYSGPFLSSKRFFLAATLKARFLAARTLNITHLFSGGWSQSSQIQPIDWCW